MTSTKIPIYKPYLGKEETEKVMECMESSWISSQGAYIKEFERKVQEYTGAKNAITVSNGTVALHLAMLALGIGPGDEVITTNFSYVASSNAILYVGATPVFVDIDPGSWNLEASLIESKIGPATRAILFTNIYGVPADFFALREIADRHNLFLIEDAAESFGASYDGLMSGTLGDISTFSFFGNKTLTTGEGGMVLTSNEIYSQKIRKLKNQGNSETVRYYHDFLGYNYRMTNIQAAIGVAQIEKIDLILKLKREIDLRYRSGLKGGLQFQQIAPSIRSSYWMSTVLFETRAQKKRVIEALEKVNVETRPFFMPIDELPFYQSTTGCYVSRDISARGLNLPSYPNLSTDEQNRIITTINKHI